MPKNTKEKKSEIAPYNFWIDPTVPGKQFTQAEFIEHLKTAHNVDAKNTKGKRSMNMHIDGDTWFSYVWDWEIDGKKFKQHTRQNRTSMNRQIWAHE